jgi:hypothetical protein
MNWQSLYLWGAGRIERKFSVMSGRALRALSLSCFSIHHPDERRLKPSPQNHNDIGKVLLKNTGKLLGEYLVFILSRVNEQSPLGL